MNIWEQVLNYFPITGKFKKLCEDSEFENVCLSVIEAGIGDIIITLSTESIKNRLKEKLIPEFYNEMQILSTSINKQFPLEYVKFFQTFSNTISHLLMDVAKLQSIVARCEHLEASAMKLNRPLMKKHNFDLELYFFSGLHCNLNEATSQIIGEIYSAVFKIYRFRNNFMVNEEMAKAGLDMCPGCEYEDKACCCEQIYLLFEIFNKDLRSLGLIERLTGSKITDLLFEAISEYILSITRDSYDQHLVSSLEEWQYSLVEGWLEFVYCGTQNNLSNAPTKTIRMIKKNAEEVFRYLLYHKYTQCRIEQLFNIIIEFPDSQPALEDIKECLIKTNLRDQLITTLKSSIKNRLLHAGVSTADILHAYISTIKALRLLDPKGIFLELISSPIRIYLRKRSDFVRYIITNLTDQSNSDLGEELSNIPRVGFNDSFYEIEDFATWDTWTPDPSHADYKCQWKTYRHADIISMLINIYGSKDVFITEYRTLLADRILKNFSYHTEKEIRYLEHLKLRFGEAQLHKCEVMVKDVVDSKRINTSIRTSHKKSEQQNALDFEVNSIILSAHFWPTFKHETLAVPSDIVSVLDNYKKSFEKIKDNRTLNWKYHLGQVNMDIETNGKVINMVVPSVQAIIILQFEKNSVWQLSDLSDVTQIPQTSLRRKMAFWQAHGLIEEISTDTFSFIEYSGKEQTLTPRQPNYSTQESIYDDNDSVMASVQDQRQEEFQVLWSYIVGMLTNLDCLPLDKIHSMLKMFVEDSIECTVDELRSFLQMKITSNQLTLSNGEYKLAK